MIERAKVDAEAQRQRERAHDSVEAHALELEARIRFVTVADLAERWQCSETAVRDISYSELPYLNIGKGGRRVHRRYDPRVVEAFERRGRGK